MSCDELLALLRGGAPPDSPAAAAHLQACPECAELARELAPLTGALTGALAGAGAGPVELAGLQAGLRARLRAERGPLAWLRSRPTWLRFALLLLLALAGPLGWSLARGIPLRSDLAQLWMPRFLMEAGLLLLVVLAGAWTALRPLHRPALRPGAALAGVVLSLLLAVGLALLPQAHAGPHPLEPAGQCLMVGLQFGLPLVVCALLLSRLVSWPVVALAGLSAGMLADLGLYVVCPDPRPMHLLLGHASVVAVYAAVVMGLGLLRR